MNNLIERMKMFAAVTDRRYKTRKLRTDSILGGLPSQQRAQVDKWLFDKGMTYQEVAEACGEMFGVRVSRSSVGRYFQAKSNVSSPKSKVGEGKWARFEQKETKVRGNEGAGLKTDVFSYPDGRGTEGPVDGNALYQQLMAKVMELAWSEANLPDELRDVKHFCRLMRLLIAARRERNQAVLAEVQRKKFEIRAAKEVLGYLRYSISDLRGRKGRRAFCNNRTTSW